MGNKTWCVEASSLRSFFPEDETTAVTLNLTVILSDISRKDSTNCSVEVGAGTGEEIHFDSPQLDILFK